MNLHKAAVLLALGLCLLRYSEAIPIERILAAEDAAKVAEGDGKADGVDADVAAENNGVGDKAEPEDVAESPEDDATKKEEAASKKDDVTSPTEDNEKAEGENEDSTQAADESSSEAKGKDVAAAEADAEAEEDSAKENKADEEASVEDATAKKGEVLSAEEKEDDDSTQDSKSSPDDKEKKRSNVTAGDEGITDEKDDDGSLEPDAILTASVRGKSHRRQWGGGGYGGHGGGDHGGHHMDEHGHHEHGHHEDDHHHHDHGYEFYEEWGEHGGHEGEHGEHEHGGHHEGHHGGHGGGGGYGGGGGGYGGHGEHEGHHGHEEGHHHHEHDHHHHGHHHGFVHEWGHHEGGHHGGHGGHEGEHGIHTHGHHGGHHGGGYGGIGYGWGKSMVLAAGGAARIPAHIPNPGFFSSASELLPEEVEEVSGESRTIRDAANCDGGNCVAEIEGSENELPWVRPEAIGHYTRPWQQHLHPFAGYAVFNPGMDWNGCNGDGCMPLTTLPAEPVAYPNGGWRQDGPVTAGYHIHDPGTNAYFDRADSRPELIRGRRYTICNDCVDLQGGFKRCGCMHHGDDDEEGEHGHHGAHYPLGGWYGWGGWPWGTFGDFVGHGGYAQVCGPVHGHGYHSEAPHHVFGHGNGGYGGHGLSGHNDHGHHGGHHGWSVCRALVSTPQAFGQVSFAPRAYVHPLGYGEYTGVGYGEALHDVGPCTGTSCGNGYWPGHLSYPYVGAGYSSGHLNTETAVCGPTSFSTQHVAHHVTEPATHHTTHHHRTHHHTVVHDIHHHHPHVHHHDVHHHDIEHHHCQHLDHHCHHHGRHCEHFNHYCVGHEPSQDVVYGGTLPCVGGLSAPAFYCRDEINSADPENPERRFCVPVGYRGGYGWPYWHGYPGVGLGLWGWGWPWIKDKVPKTAGYKAPGKISTSAEKVKNKGKLSARSDVPDVPLQGQATKKQTIHVGYGYASGDNYRLGYGLGGMGGIQQGMEKDLFPADVEGHINGKKSAVEHASTASVENTSAEPSHDLQQNSKKRDGETLGAAYGNAVPYGHPVTHPGFTTVGFPGHGDSSLGFSGGSFERNSVPAPAKKSKRGINEFDDYFVEFEDYP